MTTRNGNLDIYKYFILTFLISWILWSPFYFLKEASEVWVLPGAWGPTIAAILLTYYREGKRGIRELLKRILVWRVPFKYYLFSIFGVLLLATISIFIYSSFGNAIPDSTILLKGMGLSEGQLGLAILLSPIFFLISTVFGGPIAEELGWRGYAQEMMQQRLGPNFTGLIIGFLWGIWHLPLILFFPKAIGDIPVWVYIPLMTSMGVIFSWLYNRTKRSVLLAVLLHGGMNFTLGFLGADILKNQNLLMVQVGLIIVIAIILAKSNKKEETKQSINDNFTFGSSKTIPQDWKTYRFQKK